MQQGSPQAGHPAVLVTGASSGIGLATAVHLAQRGFRVYASMRDPARRDALEAEAARRGVHIHVLRLDVTDSASIRLAVEHVIADNGAIFGLVNNAGVQLRGFFEDLAMAEIRRLFETNLFGALAVTRAVLPHMRQRGNGRVVLVSSVLGRLGMSGLSAYCAAKFGLAGFGESLALEMAPLGVKVSIVEPGLVKTQIWERNRGTAERANSPASPYYAHFQRMEQWADRLLARAPVSVEDVARVIGIALTAAQPKLHYVVGARAGFLLALRRYLPEELFHRVYASILAGRAINV